MYAGVVFVMVAVILAIAFYVMTLAPFAIGMVVVAISNFTNLYKDDDDFRFEFLGVGDDSSFLMKMSIFDTLQIFGTIWCQRSKFYHFWKFGEDIQMTDNFFFLGMRRIEVKFFQLAEIVHFGDNIWFAPKFFSSFIDLRWSEC